MDYRTSNYHAITVRVDLILMVRKHGNFILIKKTKKKKRENTFSDVENL